MLRFLLDQHVSTRVALQLNKRLRSLVAYDLSSWNEGRFYGAHDDEILTAAHQSSLTLVSFDVSTIPNILSDWTVTGRSHSGVVFISHRTMMSSNVGAMVLALELLWKEERDSDWTNRVRFLQSSK